MTILPQRMPLIAGRLLTRPSAATQSGFPIRDSGFPKGNDPGIRNRESGIRNPQMAQGVGSLRKALGVGLSWSGCSTE